MADLVRIEVVNWDRFQHYKERTPPWIKLHRSLLDSRQWGALSGDASKLLAECWLVASESPDGSWEGDPEDLAFRLRRPCGVLLTLLQEIAAQGLIKLARSGASAMLATCTPETETETETETESQTGAVTESKAERIDRLFESEFWPRYPVRKGSRGKKDAKSAWRARCREGIEPEAIIEAANRYHRYCEVGKKIGTEYVKLAKSFLNDPDNFSNPWTPPTTEEMPKPKRAEPPPPDSEAARVRSEQPRSDTPRNGEMTLAGKDLTERQERQKRLDDWKRKHAEELDVLRNDAIDEMGMALAAFGSKPDVARKLVETKVDEMIWAKLREHAA
jgi:hypothetical protein